MAGEIVAYSHFDPKTRIYTLADGTKVHEYELYAHAKPLLPLTAKDRKAVPIASGVLDYFPKAIAEIAHVSWVGNEQHNPGEKLRWAREKSTDHADALMRHFMERGGKDIDGQRHSAKAAWRALALLQEELEAEQVAPAGQGEV